MRSVCGVLIGLLCLSALAVTAHGNMTLTIPKALEAPTIDGKLSAGEWDDAVAITGLINQLDGLAHPRQATFWVKYDDENFYIAQRSPLRKGERKMKVLMPARYYGGREDLVVASIAPGRKRSGDSPSAFRFRADDEGPRNKLQGGQWLIHDDFFEIFDRVAGESFLSVSQGCSAWSCDGTRSYTVMDGKNFIDKDETIWESEYVIPLKNMAVKKVKDGETWGLLLARDYPMGEQNAIVPTTSWHFNLSGFRPWSNVCFFNAYHKQDEYAKATLREGAPAVQILSLGDLLAGNISPRIAVKNTGAKNVTIKLSCSLLADYGMGGVNPEQREELTLKPGERKEMTFPPVTAVPGIRSTLTIRVKDGKDNLLYQHIIPLKPGYAKEKMEVIPQIYFSGPNKSGKDEHVIYPHYNPIRNTITARVRLDGHEQWKELSPKVTLEVRKPGEEQPIFEADFGEPVRDWWEFKLTRELPELAPGLYKLIARAFSKDGKLLGVGEDYFVRHDHEKELPWLNNKIGISNDVPSPWTPIKTDRKKAGNILDLSCWNRVYRVDGSGLFAGVTAGEARNVKIGPDGQVARDDKAADMPPEKMTEILAAPVRIELVRDGEPVALTPDTEPSAVQVADHEASWRGVLAGGGWRIETAVTMEYDGYALHRVRIVPPGAQPGSDGSDKSDAARVDRIRFVIPLRPECARFIHVAGGGQFFRSKVTTRALPANKQGRLWTSRGNATPGFKLGKSGFLPWFWVGGVTHGIGFMADNDKGWVPDDDNGKTGAFEVVRDGETVNMVLNLVARPFTFTQAREITFSLQATPVRPLPTDHRQARRRLRLQTAFPGSHPDGSGWSLDGQQLWINNGKFHYIGGHGSSHYPVSWERNKQAREYWEKRGAYFTPYQCMSPFTMSPAEVNDPRVPGLHGQNIYGYLSPELMGYHHLYDAGMVSTEVDYRIWRYQRWIRESGLSGLYFDNSFSLPVDNLADGQAYRFDLPDRPKLHGRIQPGYSYTKIRQFLKRLRAIFLAEGRRPAIWLHATDTFIVSAFSHADYLLDGENTPYLTPEKPWYSEKYSQDHMQTLHSGAKWGLPITTLEMVAAGFGPSHLDRRYQDTMRNAGGYLLVHDGHGERTDQAWSATGLDLTRPATFLPYWDTNVAAAIKADNQKVLISGWRQDNSLTLLIFNPTADALNDLKVSVDAGALGLTAQRDARLVVVDPEAGIYLANDVRAWGRPRNYQLKDGMSGREQYEHVRTAPAAPMNYTVNGLSVAITLDVLPRNYRVVHLRNVKDPDAVPGLKLWVVAGKGFTRESWQDQGPGKIDLIQPEGGKRPAMAEETIAGHPAVRFSRGSSAMMLAGDVKLDPAKSTVFVAGRFPDENWPHVRCLVNPRDKWIKIDARGVSNSGRFDADVAEIIVFDRKLSSAEAHAVRGYLVEKYRP